MSRYACFSLDFELDYGRRLGARFDTLNNKEGHLKLAGLCKSEKAPLSAFVHTDVFEHFPKAIDVLARLSSDIHSHSHTHSKENFQSRAELERSKELIKSLFGNANCGYRAPFGKLYKGDVELLKELGYSFDSSVFPSFRPGYFNHLASPIEPYRHPNGLLEIPFGAVPVVRLILGISYMKLLGLNTYKFFMRSLGLPKVVMFYGHMHDYFPTEGLSSLPSPIKQLMSRNREKGLNITRDFFHFLQEKGYEFLSLSELADKLEKENLPVYPKLEKK